MFKNISRVALVLIIPTLVSSPIHAQRQTGSIEGKTVDSVGIPLPGVTVSLTGPSLMGTLTYSTSITGDFRFPSVPPGQDFELTFKLPGFKNLKREGIIVSVGKTITMAITLDEAAVEEEITIVATTPVIDIKSSKISVNYAAEMLDHIPLARDYYDVIMAAPGIVSERIEGHRSFVSQGGTVRSNQVAVDGINITDPGTGTNMLGMPFDIFEEVELELGSHPAEVGMTDGAYINVVTKSGGNKFHGQALVYFFNDSMAKRLIPQEEVEAVGLREIAGYKRWNDFSLTLGGPIFNDKLWFFLNSRPIKTIWEGETLPDGIFEAPKKEIMTFAKLTWKPHSNWKIVGAWSFRNIDEPILTSFGTDYYSSKWTLPYVNNAQSHTILAQVNWILSQNTFVDARFNYLSTYDPWRLHPDLDPYASTHMDLSTNITYGSPPHNEDFYTKRYQYLFSGTHFLDSFLRGDHEIKFGIEYENAPGTWDWYKKNPYSSLTYEGLPWGLHNIQPYLGMFQAATHGANPGETAPKWRLRRFSFYIQDSFSFVDRLTLNLGIRYDESRGDIIGGTFLPVGRNDPILTMIAPQIFKETSLDDTTNAVVWKDFSPRIGAVFDVFGDGTTSLKASWSRYNEFLLSQYFMVMTPVYPDSVQSLWFDLNQNGEYDVTDSFIPQYFPLDPSTYELSDNLDPNLSSPYTNERVFGLERELLKELSVGVFFIHKVKRSIVEDVEKLRGYKADSGSWLPYSVTEPGWDGEFGTSDDKEITVYGVKNGAPESRRIFTNPEEAKRKYRAVELILKKRMSNNWQLLASVTLSKYEGNIDAGFGATSGFSSAFDTPNWAVNRYGRLSFDRPLQIKLQGSVLLPWDFIVSGYYMHMSGIPWTRTLRIYFPDDPQFDPTNRSYVTVNADSSGSYRKQARNNLDMRVEKTFRIGRFGRFGIFLDVLNVFGESWFEVNLDPGGYIYPDGSFERWPSYGEHTEAQGLRTFKLSARFSF